MSSVNSDKYKIKLKNSSGSVEQDLNTDIEKNSYMKLISNNSINLIERGGYKLYVLRNLKDFCENIELFTNNNPINLNHLQNLKKAFSKNCNNCLDGIFIVIKFKDNRIILLDGHHRVRAFKELYEQKDFVMDFSYEVHLYEMDFEYDQYNDDVLKLFYQINNTKPYKTICDIISISVYIFKSLKKKYPRLFTQSKTRANFPHIREQQFNEKLIEKLYETEIINKEKILDNIYKKNREFEVNCLEILKKIRPNKFLEDLEKINKFGIYLGIKRNNIDWLDDIF